MEGDATFEGFYGILVKRAIDFYIIFLLDMLVGVEHAVPQRTIIRHEKQSFSIPVESSERVEAFDGGYQCNQVRLRSSKVAIA